MAIPGPKAWLAQVFSAKAVKGGVIRRSVDDVKKYGGGLVNLKAIVKLRGFHLIRTGDQYVVLCHKGDIRVIC